MSIQTHTVFRGDELPPFPSAASALLVLAAKEDVGLADVTEILATDAALSAELLRVANAAFVGVRGEVESINQAAAILGLKRISSLAATVALRGYLGTAWASPIVRRCWHHNLATALTAETMARDLSLDANLAYTAGLLHDAGRLALIVKCRDRYMRLLKSMPVDGQDCRDLERERLGIDHVEASCALLEAISLPPVLRDSARHHHDVTVMTTVDIVHVVRVACTLATRLGFGAYGPPPPPVELADVDAILRVLPAPAYDALARDHECLVETVTDLMAAYDRALA
jgi:putative nucleotidyltransferase with HDIG domain